MYEKTQMTLGMYSHGFLDKTLKTNYVKEIIDKWDIFRMEFVCSIKDSVKRMKREVRLGENMCRRHILKRTI